MDKSVEDILGDMDMIEFLGRCRVDFKFFCENVLPDLFKEEFGGLKDYMLNWFQMIQNNERVVIRAPSGFAKTTLLIAYAIWIAFTYSSKQIMIVSKTLPQARRLLEILKSTIEDNPILKELKPESADIWSSEQIKTTSKCRIFVRPYSMNIKGERTDFNILDEADSYERPEIYFDYIIPRLNPKGKIAMISTPEGGSSLMSQIEDKKLTKKDGGDYIMLTTKAVDENGKAIWPERFSLEKLKRLKDELGEQYYEKNFMCNTKAEPEHAIFKMSAVVSGFDDTISFTTDHKGVCFIGCDFAYSSSPRADYDAFLVIERLNNFFIIKTIETYRGLGAPAKEDRIFELNKTYNPISVICDESNVGGPLIDNLRGRAIPVVPQKFSPEKRKELLKSLQNVIDAGKLVIPRHPEVVDVTNTLVEQLMGFRREKSPVTQIEFPKSSAAHDDIVMALAMAVKEAAEMRSASMTEQW